MGLHRGGIGCTFQGQFPVSEATLEALGGMDPPVRSKADRIPSGF
jgi:hypothetical protein